MRQIKSFKIEATTNGSIAEAIDETVNPFMASVEDASVEAATVEMVGSWHKATVIVSYESNGSSGDAVNEPPKRRGRPPKK